MSQANQIEKAHGTRIEILQNAELVLICNSRCLSHFSVCKGFETCQARFPRLLPRVFRVVYKAEGYIQTNIIKAKYTDATVAFLPKLKMTKSNTQVSQNIPIKTSRKAAVYIQKTQKHKMMQEERCNYDEIVMSIIKYDLCEWTTQLDWTKINNQKAAEGKTEK